MSTLSPSTLGHHVYTALRSGGYSLRDRVVTPDRTFPIHILPFDLYENQSLVDFTGSQVELKPGCWIFSLEENNARWDATNLTSIWLFQGRASFWDHLSKSGVNVDDGLERLIGFVGDANGLVKWSFTIPKTVTANQAKEIIAVYVEEHFTPSPEQQLHMYADLRMIGALIGHLASTTPTIHYELHEYAKPGFAPLLDELLGLMSNEPIAHSASTLLEVPDSVRMHVERTFSDRIPHFPYTHVERNVLVPVYGVQHAAQESVIMDVDVDSTARLEPGCWITAPFDPLDMWPSHDLVAFTFIRMSQHYWTSQDETMQADKWLLCLVSNIGGPRPWYYHVPVNIGFTDTDDVADAVTEYDIELSEHQDVIEADLAMIGRIGVLIAKNHKFLRWGECHVAPEAGPPVNWMAQLLNTPLPKGG